MILKTYTRLFTTDLDASLGVLIALHGNAPHLRFRFEDWELVGIGDILLVAGTEEALLPIRGSHGPWIVDDLDGARAALVEQGAAITRDIQPSPTGRFLYARHPDGIVVEYVEWHPDLVEQFIRRPLRNGQTASQL